MASLFVRKAKFQTLLIFGFAIIALILSVLLPWLMRPADAASPYFWLGLVGMVVGYGMLVRAKWSQIRGGDFFSWGISSDSRNRKLIYFLSYPTMIVGLLMACFSGQL